MKKITIPLLFFLILITFWEIASMNSSKLLLILPSPSSILNALLMKHDRFLFHGKETFKVMIGGFMFAFAAAFPLAWAMSYWRNASKLLQPLFIITQCVPMFALAPIMVAWFGWGYTAIVIPTALMIFFPLTMNLYQGLKSTPVYLLDYFRTHQATPFQLFFNLQLPWSLPHIFAGLRISAAIAGIGAIAGEWAGAQDGLGILMLESRRGSDLDITFAALVCLTLVSLGMYGGFSLLERSIFSKKFVHLAKRGAQACLLIFGVVLTSCSGEPKTGQIKETRLVLDWLPNPNHIPLFVGIDKGFFKSRGIELKIHKVRDPSDPQPFLSSGQVELAISYQPSVTRANLRGSNFKPIAILFDQPLNGLIYRTNSGIETPQDLNGKVFGYCIDGTSTKFLDHILKKNQIVPKERRNVSFDLVSTLGNQHVDVVYGAYWNIECEQLRNLGIDTDHFTLTSLGFPNYYELIVIANGNSPEASEEFISQFQEAMKESIKYSQDYPEEAFEIYVYANPDKSAKTIAWEKEAWKKTFPLLASSQKVDEQAWKAFEDWIKTF